nr:MAG TPA: hypothetical protein [Caudoviricetes sp.]
MLPRTTNRPPTFYTGLASCSWAFIKLIHINIYI